jgi:hypothetical protein
MLHPSLLKNCVDAFTVPLTLIFKQSLSTSQLPIQFRSANVTPLFKIGDKTILLLFRARLWSDIIEDHFYKKFSC